MNGLMFLATLVLALLATTAVATPVPAGGPATGGPGSSGAPSGLPPNNPTATVEYSNGGGSAFLDGQGTFQDVQTQCRGLDGTKNLVYVNVFTAYPDGRKAYKLRFYGQWACQGNPIAETAFFSNNGQPLLGSDGKPITPLSARFVPA
ncbi:hypothetical protein H9P43_002006 [Blastocladiella emersonii ATCC 22665]|nr:hypothetical protein H9P43_002006 [Blastocladiella emersonii ATCC 22665]